MENCTLYLVRHGALITDKRRRFVGQMDVPLSEEGIAQAHALHDRLKYSGIRQIYCSDLSRSRETAAIIAGGGEIPIVPLWDLREISLGLWEGCAMADIAARYPEAFQARGKDIENYRPQGGESFSDCRTRVLTALEEILAHSNGNTLIVGHAGVNRLILCEALGIPISNLFRIGQQYGCLNVLECGDSGYRVTLVNFTPGNMPFETNSVSPVPVPVS
jgi:probable phosphoglycerate mutase